MDKLYVELKFALRKAETPLINWAHLAQMFAYRGIVRFYIGETNGFSVSLQTVYASKADGYHW